MVTQSPLPDTFATPATAPAPISMHPSSRSLIAAASGDAWSARAATRMAVARRLRARARLASIDAILDYLEARHLQGERTYDRLVRVRIRRLEQEVGLPLPRKALRARNTVRLHAALLDWQEQVLDEIAPQRLSYPDVYDADWNAVTPSYADAV